MSTVSRGSPERAPVVRSVSDGTSAALSRRRQQHAGDGAGRAGPHQAGERSPQPLPERSHGTIMPGRRHDGAPVAEDAAA